MELDTDEARHAIQGLNEANRWDVVCSTTDATIDEIIDDYSDEATAQAVLQDIVDHTMASIESDGTVIAGLYEYEICMRISLSKVIDFWISGRVNSAGEYDEESATEAAALATILERLAADLRRPTLEQERRPS